ncbi:uncharacterized protein LOC108101849 [Drosophila ficusphila]|uniref:uncharacterized protein LOC108101849 n=1 Tax=Drosophila ficusphila TaxID=30025 RepID=UPI0007E5D6E4|nr:uncharacterized protein LOC108101849 [Drosophila ficusphila]
MNVATQETEVSSTSTKMPRAARQPNNFVKLKDGKPKNSHKSLKHKANKKKLDRQLVAKLLDSIKKKNKAQTNPRIKRRLDFKSKVSPAKKSGLPKPKFYRPQKSSKEPDQRQNETIEDGEVVEELMSSDDDDCVLLETPNVTINIDDEEPCTSENFFKDCQSLQTVETLTQPKIVTDLNGEAALRIKQQTENEVLYSTIVKTSELKKSIITLEDSPVQVPSPIADNNDSVIFIEDTVGGLDFIPIPSYSPPPRKGKKLKKSPRLADKPKMSRRMNDSLFTSAEKKQLGDYNSNTYNPSKDTEETSDSNKNSNKRPIIIDGSNVAFAHGNSNVFSSEGIKYCLQYFDKMGHNAKAVIPMFRKNNFKSSNPELLDKLHKEGKIVLTPCKNIPGQMSSSYDDRFILQLAYECNAAIVSNDNYRDLIHESPAFKKIIENRVLGYTWCDNIFILPKDPYGRWGPTLDEILRC